MLRYDSGTRISEWMTYFKEIGRPVSWNAINNNRVGHSRTDLPMDRDEIDVWAEANEAEKLLEYIRRWKKSNGVE